MSGFYFYNLSQKRSNKFDFLDDDQLMKLIKEYYFSEKTITKLQVEYNLPVSTYLEHHFPFFKTTSICKHCRSEMLQVPHNRKKTANVPQCRQCQHYETGCRDCRKCKKNFLDTLFENEIVLDKYNVEINKIIKILDNKVSYDAVSKFIISINYSLTDECPF